MPGPGPPFSGIPPHLHIQSRCYMHYPPTPHLACVCGGRDHSPQYTGRSGGGGEVVQQPASRSALFILTLSLSYSLHWPCHTYRPVRVSMKVEYVQGAPSHSQTQLHMQVLGHFCRGGQGLPSTIIFVLSLSLPVKVVWAAKG